MTLPLLERVNRLDQLADLGAGEDGVGCPGAVGVQGHELDEADLEVGRAREVAEAEDLVLGEVAHRDRVDFDRADLGVARDRLEAAHDLRQ